MATSKTGKKLLADFTADVTAIAPTTTSASPVAITSTSSTKTTPTVQAQPAAPQQQINYKMLLDAWEASGRKDTFRLPDGKLVSVDFRGNFDDQRTPEFIHQFNVAGAGDLSKGVSYDKYGNANQYQDSSVGQFLLENGPKLAAFMAGMQGLSGAGMFGQAGINSAATFVNPFTTTAAAGNLPVYDAGLGAFIDPATGLAMDTTTAIAKLNSAAAAGTMTSDAALSALNYANTVGVDPVTIFGSTAANNLLAAAAGVGPSAAGTGVAATGAAGAGVGAGAGTVGAGAGTTAGAVGAGTVAAGGLLTPGTVGGVLNTVGGIVAGQQAADAAQAQADAIKDAAAKVAFKPFGVTNYFGSYTPTYDANGNLIGHTQTASPQMQRALENASFFVDAYSQDLNVNPFPYRQAVQRAQNLGLDYMGTDPRERAAAYMQDQQNLLASGRERDWNRALQGEFGRGTYGLATGGTSTGMMAANPRLEALANAQRQQDLELAARATQGGMDYVKFGTGLFGTGTDIQKSMYDLQTSAFKPLEQALSTSRNIYDTGKTSMEEAMNIASAISGNAYKSANIQASAAPYQYQSQSYSPFAGLLSSAGNVISNLVRPPQQPQQPQPAYDPNAYSYYGM